MPQVGDSHTPSIDTPGGDATTGALLTVVRPDDVAVDPPVSPAPDFQQWQTDTALVFDVPGPWRLIWQVAGPGTARSDVTIPVDPDPDALPAGASFATLADLTSYLGKVPPAGARRQLLDATREIERITRTAVYAVDEQGMPANPRLRRALVDATCELWAWWDETGLETGGRGLYTSASIAGVSLGMSGANTANPQADRVGPKCWSILINAGLISPGSVLTYG